MSFLTSLSSFLNGNLFGELKDLVVTYLPPSMSEQQKLEYQLKVQQHLAEFQLKTNQELNAASIALDKRIAEQEGTATDLKAMPILGKIMLFLRGAQRPIWGYATLYIDFLWFFEVEQLSQQQEKALLIINVLVLGFLFGERTLLNLEPLLTKLFAKNT